MREDDNRMIVERLQIAGQDMRVVVAQQALSVPRRVQRNEMDSLVIEALMGDAKSH